MLLRGASGVGKSDLALRALQGGWRVAADDRVLAWRSGGRLFGRAPCAIRGLVEARGQAILRLAPQAFAPIDLVADLVGAGAPLERLPDEARVEILGASLPRLALRGVEASALARLALALQANDSPAAKAPL